METKYEYREDGCDRCGTTEVEVTESESRGGYSRPVEKQMVCCFCYETLLGNILDYPQNYPGMTTPIQGLIQALHIIRREIKESK